MTFVHKARDGVACRLQQSPLFESAGQFLRQFAAAAHHLGTLRDPVARASIRVLPTYNCPSVQFDNRQHPSSVRDTLIDPDQSRIPVEALQFRRSWCVDHFHHHGATFAAAVAAADMDAIAIRR